MSYALAIATVSAVLKSLLDNRLAVQGVAASVGDVTVTALPPDRISVGAEERSQLNLFLYRITPNTALRRAAREGAGGARDRAAGDGPDSLPPLALDLHYLLSAYGEQDLHMEILLGYAIQLLHETPVLTPERIRSALAASNREGAALPPARAALSAAHLADRVERIGITPEYLSAEEGSRLWSTLQARYRPSAAFKVSPVMIAADG
jgi:hypothetical protein